jgi:hypothetical protein
MVGVPVCRMGMGMYNLGRVGGTYSIRKNIHGAEISLRRFCRNGSSVCGFVKGLGR